jgi:competence protein ComEC
MKLFYVCIAWMAGIALGAGLPLSWIALLIAGIFLFLFALTFANRVQLSLICLATVLMGAARCIAAQPSAGPAFLGSHVGETVDVEAILAEDGSLSGKGLRVRAGQIRLHTSDGAIQPVDGLIMVDFSRPPDKWNPVYGDAVRLRARLDPPPVVDGFDYAAYLARQGVYAVAADPQLESVTPDQGNFFFAALHAIRRKGLQTIAAIFPEPEAALLQGILLGDDSGIPKEVSKAFAQTGTSHIIAISGFNISIVAGILLALTGLLPRRFPSWLLAILGIAAYSLLVGASASVVRAAIMGSMALIARQLGRMSHGLTTLAFSGAVMTLGNPATLWDVGFQLSMAATLGIIVYADPLQHSLERLLMRSMPAARARAGAETAGEILLLTLAAQLTTLPLLLYYFRSLSLSALIVNPLVLPLQPMVMIASGIAMAAGMIWIPLGQLMAWVAWPSAAFTIRMVEWGAGLPGGWHAVGAVSPWWVTAWYAVLLGGSAVWHAGRLPPLPVGSTAPTKAAGFALPVLMAIVFAAWCAWCNLPDGRLHMILLPAAGGEAILVRSPNGGAVLVNGGGDTLSAADGVGRRLGFWRRGLDWAVLASTADADSAGWMELAARDRIGNVWIPADPKGMGKLASAFLDECRRRGIPLTMAHTGDVLDLGDGAQLEVIAGTSAGLVLMVSDGNAHWLLPSGLTLEGMRSLVSHGQVPSAQVLVMARGGSPSVNSMDWLRAVNPLLGWSAGGANTGLAWLEGRTLLRADVDGEVEWATDGEQMWAWRRR